MIEVFKVIEEGIIFRVSVEEGIYDSVLLSPQKAFELEKSIRKSLAEWSQLTGRYIDSGKKKGKD